MDLSFTSDALETLDVELLGIVISDPDEFPPALISLDQHLDGAIRRELNRASIKPDKPWTVHINGGKSGPQRIVLAGCHETKEQQLTDCLRTIGAKIAAAATTSKSHSVALLALEESSNTQSLVEGVILGSFKIHHYTSSNKDGGNKKITSLTLVGDIKEELKTLAQRGKTLACAQNWARDLANAPANLMPPIELAKNARDLAEQHEHLSFRELTREQIIAEGMGLFAAVARGSFDEPRCLVLEWNPPTATEADSERLALVGKAVTFDTGGISIKPTSGMEGMKMDKSGGCTVLGAMRAIAELNVNRRVLAVVGATTNMPDGNAYRPGDVLTAKDGTTVEVISTDAEGRLVLSDCIVYARELGCGAIVEASTLTGAMVVALGHHYGGAIAEPDSELLNQVITTAKKTGDHAWPMPIHSAYTGNLKTDCADFKNSGARDAGALSAGGFLAHFAKDTPFVHLDVAGCGMLSKPQLWYNAKGASGWGVRLMTLLAETRE